jgi:hypothetical protein
VCPRARRPRITPIAIAGGATAIRMPLASRAAPVFVGAVKRGYGDRGDEDRAADGGQSRDAPVHLAGSIAQSPFDAKRELGPLPARASQLVVRGGPGGSRRPLPRDGRPATGAEAGDDVTS